MDKTKIVISQKLDRAFILQNKSVKTSDDIREGNVYYLSGKKGHSLKVTDNGKEFLIEGSLRQWYFGRTSLEDLSGFQILDVCELLATNLGTSIDAILDARLLIVEFGFNLILSVKANTILRKVYKYGIYTPVIDDNSVSFRTKGYWFTLYDKENELYKKKNNVSGLEYNCLRVELKAFTYNSIAKLYRGAETVRDFINSYRMIIVSWIKEFKEILIEPSIISRDDVDFHYKDWRTLKDYIFAYGLSQLGLKVVNKYIGQSTLTIKAKSKRRKYARTVQSRFENKRVYGKRELLGEVLKQLAPKISLPVPRL